MGKMGNRKRYILLFVAGILILTVCIFLWGKIWSEDGGESERYISRAGAARMLTLLEAEPEEVNTDPVMWFEKYIFYLTENEKINWDDSYLNGDKAYAALTYGELKEYLLRGNWNLEEVSQYTDIKIEKKKAARQVAKTDFIKIYDYLVLKSGSATGVVRKEITIVGTPANMRGEQISQYGAWICAATDGIYSFEGLSVDAYADSTICAYTRNHQIISIITVVSEEITYPNVWLSEGEENHLTAYICGVYREFTTGKISGKITDTIGNLYLKNGQIVSILLKEDTITGKVLKISDETLELSGYGTIPVSEDFKVYKNYGMLEEKSLNDILVGYELSDFVIEDKKVCAAIINKELNAQDIRVLIMDTNYQSLFHNRITISSDSGFTMKYGENTKHFEAGEIVDIYPDSEYMKEGRITFKAHGINNSIKVLSIERAYGTPYYYGTLEVAIEGSQLAVINELPLEEYLYHVVPSEMPVSFGVEALKVQAVCARSYAYKHLINNSYRMYGAHVDDSVNYQVYNNIEEQPDSTQAVKETYGEVLAKENEEVIAAYYFSTSCGHLSDISLWNGDTSQYDMYVSKNVDPEGGYSDLSTEETFYEFISQKDERDYDYEFPFYRWQVELSLSYLTERINSMIGQRYESSPDSILVKNETGAYISEPVRSIGALLSIEVVERSSGGAVKQLILHGTEKEALVSGELNIRYLLGPGENLIDTNTDTQTTFYILPSTYVYFEEIEEDGMLAGYRMIGGGYGHGIGMSQNAVSAMVKQGLRYEQIIDFFYEGVSITNIYD